MRSLVILIMVAFSFVAFADQRAITDDGKSVILSDDGTWKLAPKKSSAEAAGYKNTRWGMSPKKVKRLYPKGKWDGDIYIVSGKTAGSESMTGFRFTKKKLTSVVIIFLESHSNKNKYLLEHGALVDKLAMKYGEPETDDVWSNGLYKDDFDSWGMAVAAGHLSLRAIWRGEKTVITAVCRGDNFRITRSILYSSVEYLQMEAAAQDNRDLADL